MKRKARYVIAVLAVCTVSAMTATFTGCKLTDTIKEKIEQLKNSSTNDADDPSSWMGNGKAETFSKWLLCTSADDLSVGDQIVIVVQSAEYALGTTQNTSNRSAASVKKNGHTVTLGEDVQIITLGTGTLESTFALNVGTGYLYAPSSSSNQLKTHAEIDANSSWRIVIDSSCVASIVAQGASVNNTLLYNTTSNLFSCYSSVQEPLMIYKLVE